jgi:hypothetical protein
LSSGLFENYRELLVTAPLPTKAVTAAVIIGAGDTSAQIFEILRDKVEATSNSNVKDFDFARAGRWALFGLVLQAPWNHYFYLILDSSLPPTVDPFTQTTLIKVLVDQFIQAPIFTAIIFLYFALIEGKGLESGVSKIKKDLFQVLLKNWAVFLPATIFNLGFLPNELRVLFLNGVFFFWTIFLSLTVNQSSNNELDDGSS